MLLSHPSTTNFQHSINQPLATKSLLPQLSNRPLHSSDLILCRVIVPHARFRFQDGMLLQVRSGLLQGRYLTLHGRELGRDECVASGLEEGGRLVVEGWCSLVFVEGGGLDACRQVGEDEVWGA